MHSHRAPCFPEARPRGPGIAEINAMLADGALKTTIAERFSLDHIVAAHEMVERAAHIGNVVLEIG